MQQKTEAEYKTLLTSVIKKQMVILGPFITLAKARNVKGLSVDDQGNITQISGNPQMLIQGLIDQFVQLSGLIVKKTMEPLLGEYDGLAFPIPEQITQTPVSSKSAPIPTQTDQPQQSTPAQTNSDNQPIPNS